ncbi:hypothetical protein D3C81_1854980 [compost metagenome]
MGVGCGLPAAALGLVQHGFPDDGLEGAGCFREGLGIIQMLPGLQVPVKAGFPEVPPAEEGGAQDCVQPGQIKGRQESDGRVHISHEQQQQLQHQEEQEPAAALLQVAADHRVPSSVAM